MNSEKEWYVRMNDGNVYGPADVASLVSWAEDGRIDPTSSLSKDRIKWTPAQLMDVLGMKWLVELEPGKPLGPYNRKFLVSSLADGSLPADAKAYRLHEFPIEQDPPPSVGGDLAYGGKDHAGGGKPRRGGELVKGDRGNGSAGDLQKIDVPNGEPFPRFARVAPEQGGGARAEGKTRGVGKVEKVGGGKRPTDRRKDEQPAEPAVKDADHGAAPVAKKTKRRISVGNGTPIAAARSGNILLSVSPGRVFTSFRTSPPSVKKKSTRA